MAAYNEVTFKIYHKGLDSYSAITMSWGAKSPVVIYRTLTDIAQVMANEFDRNVAISGEHIGTIHISPEDKTNG